MLEMLVDAYNPEFVEKSMRPVVSELMQALWAHLEPTSPYGVKVFCSLLAALHMNDFAWLQ